MTNSNLLHGELVRLVVMDTKPFSEAFSRWQRDSEYWRLQASNPSLPHSPQSIKKWFDDQAESDPTTHAFVIRTLSNDLLIGEIALDGIQWIHGDTFVGIGIGNREYWGCGYGTDAMRVILRYAFHELNLHRVSLNVYAYNARAIRSYEKIGFTYEGRSRQVINRDGQRVDLIFMGILREEWEARYLSKFE